MEPYLPDDLVMNILNWLPVRVRTKFQCVCRSWKSIISRLPLKRVPTLLLCTFSEYDHKPYTICFSSYDSKGNIVNEFSNVFHYETYPVFTSIDFVCLTDEIGRVFLCNPTTQQLIALPNNYTVGCQTVMFGRTTSTKEFKLIRFLRHKNGGLGCSVLTLGTDAQWRLVPDPQFSFVPSIRGIAFADGEIHVLVFRSTGFCICSFNLEDEEWGGIISLNLYENWFKADYILTELNSCLCLLVIFEDNKKQIMDLWLRKNLEWVKEFNIDLNTIIGPQIQREFSVRPFTVEEDGSLLLLVIIDGKAVLANCASREVIEVNAKGRIILRQSSLYLESHLSLDGFVTSHLNNLRQ